MDINKFFQIKNKYGTIGINYGIIGILVNMVLKKFKKYTFCDFFVSYLRDNFYGLKIRLKPKIPNEFKDINEIAKQITTLFYQLLKIKVVVIIKI